MATGGVGVRGIQRSKVDVLSALPAAEHRLILARQIGKVATRINRWFLATSNPLASSAYKNFLEQTPKVMLEMFGKPGLTYVVHGKYTKAV